MTDTSPEGSYSAPSREWWAQRWIEVLEGFGFMRRLARARIYAREGNVLSFTYKGAEVVAQVQGTADLPYNVTLSLEPFSAEQWGYLVESMAERAIFSAKLLAGEMPHNIEDVFTANGLSLFPFTKFDISSHCDCPDPVNPCKHIGAVYYLLGDRFSEDPFVLFQLRGRSKAQIMAALRQMRRGNQGEATPIEQPEGRQLTDDGLRFSWVDAARSAADHRALPPDPIAPLDLDRFWQYTDQLDPSLIIITPPPSPETVLDVLGELPLLPDPASLDQLKSLYSAVSMAAVGMAMASGQE